MRILSCLLLLLAFGIACQTTSNTNNYENSPSENGQVATGIFEATHTFHLKMPDNAQELKAWFAVPSKTDTDQEIENWKVVSPYPTELRKDDRGNEFLYLEVRQPQQREFDVVTSFKVTRKEVRKSTDPLKTRPLTAEELLSMKKYLTPSKEVVITDAIRQKALEVVGSEKNPSAAAKKIYDFLLKHVEYWVKYPNDKKASPVGSSVYTYEQCTGNCTDFHSLYLAMSYATGFPARIIYGSFFKGPLDGKDSDQSYHCWIEYYAPNVGWVPLDVAVADIFVGDFELNDTNNEKVQLTVADGYKGKDQKMVDYYFGNIEERRVTWNEGRDLQLSPSARSGAINALPKAHVEVDGVSAKEKEVWTRKLTFKQR
jgi:transglutaminase-like putative cysteine protease